MTTQVNPNALKTFLVNDLGIQKLDQNQAQQKYDIDADKFAEVDKDENGIDIDEIIQDADLYAQFATMYVEAHDKEEDVDKEKEKEEEIKVKDKNEAGV